MTTNEKLTKEGLPVLTDEDARNAIDSMVRYTSDNLGRTDMDFGHALMQDMLESSPNDLIDVGYDDPIATLDPSFQVFVMTLSSTFGKVKGEGRFDPLNEFPSIMYNMLAFKAHKSGIYLPHDAPMSNYFVNNFDDVLMDHMNNGQTQKTIDEIASGDNPNVAKIIVNVPLDESRRKEVVQGAMAKSYLALRFSSDYVRQHKSKK